MNDLSKLPRVLNKREYPRFESALAEQGLLDGIQDEYREVVIRDLYRHARSIYRQSLVPEEEKDRSLAITLRQVSKQWRENPENPYPRPNRR